MKIRFTKRDLIGSGFNCGFKADGYDFVEVVANIGGYLYTKLIPVSELSVYGNMPRLINVRYDSQNYYSGFYVISANGIAGITSVELVGKLNTIITLQIYGIK